MEENNQITAETTETVASGAATAEGTSVAVDVNAGENLDNNPEVKQEQQVIESQTKEQNAEFARQRREKELQAKLDKAKSEARINAIIEIVGTNPYTQEKLENELDVKIYEEMKKYESNGGDPVADQAKIIKSIMIKENQVKKEDSNEKAKSEIAELTQKYPDLDVKGLLDNQKFQLYAEGKLGKKSLKTIYEEFVTFTTPAEKIAKEVREEAKKQASVGSLRGEASQATGLLTKEQVRNMSRKEILAHYDLVQKSMASWNKKT